MAIASELEKGNYFIYNGEPVRVIRRELVAVGTHSHTKLKFYVQGLKEKGEKAVTFSHSDRVEKTDIMRKHGQVISVNGSKAQVMDMISYDTLDADAPADFPIEEGNNVTFIEFNGKVIILEKR